MQCYHSVPSAAFEAVTVCQDLVKPAFLITKAKCLEMHHLNTNTGISVKMELYPLTVGT